MSWLDEMRAEHAQVRSDMARLTLSVEAIEARLGQKLDDRFDRIDQRFARVDERLSGLKVAVADSKADLMRWMLVFWVGAVGAIAALAGVLRP